jgi:hypothetical protein
MVHLFRHIEWRAANSCDCEPYLAPVNLSWPDILFDQWLLLSRGRLVVTGAL